MPTRRPGAVPARESGRFRVSPDMHGVGLPPGPPPHGAVPVNLPHGAGGTGTETCVLLPVPPGAPGSLSLSGGSVATLGLPPPPSAASSPSAQKAQAHVLAVGTGDFRRCLLAPKILAIASESERGLPGDAIAFSPAHAEAAGGRLPGQL